MSRKGLGDASEVARKGLSRLEVALKARIMGSIVQLSGNEVKSRDVRLDVDHPRIPLPVKGLLALDRYERQEAELVEQFPPPPGPLIELGGGLGFLSSLLERHGGPAPHIVLEPDPEIARLLAINRRLNDSRFEILEKAYTPLDRDLQLCLRDDFTETSPQGSTDRTEEVEGVSLQTLVQEFDLDRFSLVMDIEGGEYRLLEEEGALLRDRCDWLLVEFHEQPNVPWGFREEVMAATGLELAGSMPQDRASQPVAVYHRPEPVPGSEER